MPIVTRGISRQPRRDESLDEPGEDEHEDQPDDDDDGSTGLFGERRSSVAIARRKHRKTDTHARGTGQHDGRQFEQSMRNDETEELRLLTGGDEHRPGHAEVGAVECKDEQGADAEEDAGAERRERHPDVVEQHRARELGCRLGAVVVLELFVDVCGSTGFVVEGR